ncbi:unnamed protein product [Didymodactylos carnosus]|nr:unnamed protein product [Didymodactylos carnosus]CAF3649773.1 unnamed protein product [Didymodactylos carnosus]
MTLLMTVSEITPQIYISGQMAATPEQITRLNITYIINVAVESSSIIYPKSVKLEKYDILDYPTAPISNYFNALTDKIHQHLSTNKQNKVLIHCMAGISRSTTIVCAYLMKYQHMTLREAYLLIKDRRPICFPNLGFWSQLIQYEYQLKHENSVKLIQTNFGHIPDVMLNEMKETKSQQPTTTVPFLSPTTSISAGGGTLFSQTLPRASGREMTISTGTLRSRSLAPNRQLPQTSSTVSSTLINGRTNENGHSTFASKQSSFLAPTATRYSIGTRLNPSSSLPPAPPSPTPQISSSSQYYVNNRPFPITTSPNLRTIGANRQLNNNFSPSTTTNGHSKPHYETTYHNLCISGLESRQAIISKGIKYVINISQECPAQDLGPAVEYEKVPILDLPAVSIHHYFDRLTERIHKNISQGKKTLIHCYVGRSRSATIVLAYLMRYKQMSLKEAFHFLRARRPIIGPNFGFIKQLIVYEKQLYGYTTVQFVETSMGRIPDLYLSSSASSSRLMRQGTTIPIHTKSSLSTNALASSPSLTVKQNVLATKTFSIPRPSSVVARSTNTLPVRSTYSSAYGTNANDFYSANESLKYGSLTQNEDRHHQHHQHRPLSTAVTMNTSNPSYASSFIKQSSSAYAPGATSTLPAPRVSSAISSGSNILIPTKLNYRTVRYVPSAYNKYRLP